MLIWRRNEIPNPKNTKEGNGHNSINHKDRRNSQGEEER